MFPGDIVVVRHDTARTARPGDVILFFRSGFFCAHRLIDKTSSDGLIRLIARGDALKKNDPAFAENELLGRVTGVIRRGKQIEFDTVRPAVGQRLLRWIVQRSGSSVKWLLRWHMLRDRLAGISSFRRNSMEGQTEGAV
jgi:hypothetical protein